MKFTTSTITALLVSAATARFVEQDEGNKVQLYPYGFYEESTEKYLIELSPGNTRWVTEDEKWALRRVSCYLSSQYHVETKCADKTFRRLANASWTSPRLRI